MKPALLEWDPREIFKEAFVIHQIAVHLSVGFPKAPGGSGRAETAVILYRPRTSKDFW